MSPASINVEDPTILLLCFQRQRQNDLYGYLYIPPTINGYALNSKFRKKRIEITFGTVTGPPYFDVLQDLKMCDFFTQIDSDTSIHIIYW